MSIYKDQIYVYGGRANKKIFNDLRVFNVVNER